MVAEENDIVLRFMEELVYHAHRLKMPEVFVQSGFERDKLPQRIEDLGAHDHHWEPKNVSLAHASQDLAAALRLVHVPHDLTDIAEDKKDEDCNQQHGKRYGDDDAQSCKKNILVC